MDEKEKLVIDQLGDEIDAKMDKATKVGIDSLTHKIDATTKTEINNMIRKYNEDHKAAELKYAALVKKNEDSQSEAVEKYETMVKSYKEELEKRVNDSEAAMKKYSEMKAETADSKLSLQGMLLKSFNEKKEDLSKVKDSAGSRLILNLKASRDMTEGNTYTGEVIEVDRVPGFVYDPTRPVHIRSLINRGPTTSNMIRYITEKEFDNQAAPVVEGIAAKQSDFKLEAKDTPVQKIGVLFRVTEEMLDDTVGLSSYIGMRGRAKFLEFEDSQLLYGSGVAPNLTGVATSAVAFSAGSYTGNYARANNFDVIVAVCNQLALKEYMPSRILMNPTDFNEILMYKGTDGQYLKNQIYEGLTPSFAGKPVVLNTAVTSGSFLIGDFNMGTMYWQRKGLDLEFFREDSDNVQTGFITVRMQERGALTTYLPNAFVKGTFAAAKAALMPTTTTTTTTTKSSSL